MNKPFYEPWVGANIKNRAGKPRILFLGESHHLNLEYEKDAPSLTIDTVTSYVKNERTPGDKNHWHGFFTRCLHLLDNKRGWISPDDRKKRWGELMFFNYIQQALGEDYRDKSPSSEAWERARESFPLVLMTIQPTHIIALGYRLWRNIIPAESNLDDCYSFHWETGRAPAIGVKHPMGGMSYKKERPRVERLLSV